MERVLVVGGSGFIGSHLAERLVIDGYTVRVFDAQPFPYATHKGNMEVVVGDMNDRETMASAIRDCDGIVHLAAISRIRAGFERPFDCITANVMGTVNVLEEARLSPTHPWIVLGSTCEVTENPKDGFTFNNLYGITKYCAELFAKQYSTDYQLRVLALKFCDVYGSERDNPGKVLPVFVHKAMSGDLIQVHDTSALYDFTSYEDIVSGICFGASYLSDCSEPIYDSVTLCTGQSVTLAELGETIVSALDSTSRIEMDTESIGGGNDWIDNDPFRALELLGFSAQVSLRDGIGRLSAALSQKAIGESKS